MTNNFIAENMQLFNLFIFMLNVVFISTTINLKKTEMKGEGVVGERNEKKAEKSTVAILKDGQLVCAYTLIKTSH
jgi:hypothetical protein